MFCHTSNSLCFEITFAVAKLSLYYNNDQIVVVFEGTDRLTTVADIRCTRTTHSGMDSRYQHAHQEPAIEMRPNWRQYLLDGAIRRPVDMSVAGPIIGMMPHSVPICLAPGPLLPPPNIGHVIRYPRGLTRRH